MHFRDALDASLAVYYPVQEKDRFWSGTTRVLLRSERSRNLEPPLGLLPLAFWLFVGLWLVQARIPHVLSPEFEAICIGHYPVHA